MDSQNKKCSFLTGLVRVESRHAGGETEPGKEIPLPGDTNPPPPDIEPGLPEDELGPEPGIINPLPPPDEGEELGGEGEMDPYIEKSILLFCIFKMFYFTTSATCFSIIFTVPSAGNSVGIKPLASKTLHESTLTSLGSCLLSVPDPVLTQGLLSTSPSTISPGTNINNDISILSQV